MLKLYVWEDCLCDYTAGVMFALAASEEEARALILAKFSYVGDDLNKTPRVVDTPEGWAVWGEG